MRYNVILSIHFGSSLKSSDGECRGLYPLI